MSLNGVLFRDTSESERPDGERGRFEFLAAKAERGMSCDEGWRGKILGSDGLLEKTLIRTYRRIYAAFQSRAGHPKRGSNNKGN